ncbi:hypothetical protein TEA_016510 [Camellia sinensis var. sinensis]|uniref:Uncharacterized protein n=1 Tax=Camellia sinensis var. sinensis TaxID=542762 RepID=A0A4S4DQM7_CAMSN|nr:hypothetical protein TEA_016510 [Camellia sinensis var. sinensis]
MPKESEKAQTSASMASSSSSSSSSFFPDVWTWIQNLPAITQWRKDSMSICICCLSSSQPSLKLSISKNPQSSSLSFSILADYNLPISLWTSKPFKLNSKFTNSIDEETISNLFGNFIEDVLNYCPNRTTSFLRIPQIDSSNNFKDIFNVSFLTLTFLICIYEAPVDLRSESLNGLKNQLACPRSRETTKLLARLVGSSLEEQWMRSVNLAITNWIVELQAMLNHSIKTPSPLFSYGVSNVGLWKVQLYCPVIAMDVEKSTNPPPDERIFNVSFLTLTFLICIYEAPADLRSVSLNVLKNQLACPRSRDTTKLLARLVGSSLEEQWMRSVNLAITNWIVELQAMLNHSIKTPSPLFSYGVSNVGLWKVQLYCPVIAMDVEKSTNPPPDERLWFSLNYHQLEGVIQLNYKVIVREKWVDVMVNVDNIRCDIIRLVTETLMTERGAGTSEKHFPSRISLQLTPQTNVLTVSVTKSSDNPTREIGLEKTLEGSFNPPNSLGLKISAVETMTTTLKPWKFEQSVYGDTANLNWFLHDSVDGREVFSSKPSKMALIQPKAWFKNRYSSVYRPFTRQGGVVFANDEYGETVGWKVERSELGKVMEWEMRGWIWLTYWPNKHRSFYSETRRLEFREILQLTLS